MQTGNLEKLSMRLHNSPSHFLDQDRLGYFEQANISKVETNEKWCDKQFRIQETNSKEVAYSKVWC